MVSSSSYKFQVKLEVISGLEVLNLSNAQRDRLKEMAIQGLESSLKITRNLSAKILTNMGYDLTNYLTNADVDPYIILGLKSKDDVKTLLKIRMSDQQANPYMRIQSAIALRSMNALANSDDLLIKISLEVLKDFNTEENRVEWLRGYWLAINTLRSIRYYEDISHLLEPLVYTDNMLIKTDVIYYLSELSRNGDLQAEALLYKLLATHPDSSLRTFISKVIP